MRGANICKTTQISLSEIRKVKWGNSCLPDTGVCVCSGTSVMSDCDPWIFPLWDSLGKNTGVGCHVLVQEIFQTQGSHPCLLHCRWILNCWATQETVVLQVPYSNSFRQLGGNEELFLSLLGPFCLQLRTIQMKKWHILRSCIQLPCIANNFHFPPKLEEAYINREVIFQVAKIVNKYCSPVL